MTRIIRTEAICLRLAPNGQTSRVVTWLSPEWGLVTTLVKGSCRPKSAFLGQFDLYYTCELLFYARRDDRLGIARECSPLVLREALRNDWRAAAAASYLCDLTAFVCRPELEAAATFQALGDALDALATGADPLTVLLWYEHHLLCRQGFAPRIEDCPACREPAAAPVRFSVSAGRVVCAHAPAAAADDTIALPGVVRETLHAWGAQSRPPVRAHEPHSADMLTGLRRFLGLFVCYHLEPVNPSRRIAISLIQSTV